MMENTTHELVGTRIHATLRAEDLIPAFLDAASDAIDYWRMDWRERFVDEMESCRRIGGWDSRLGDLERDAEALATDGPAGYCDPEEAEYVLEGLQDLLDDLAPTGHYFGALDGDGSDFGFWPDPDTPES